MVKGVSLAISRCELSWSDFVACSIHYHFHRVTPGKLYATLEMCPSEALYVKDEPLNIIAFLISGASKGISSPGQHVDICSALEKKTKRSAFVLLDGTASLKAHVFPICAALILFTLPSSLLIHIQCFFLAQNGLWGG